MNKMSIGRGRLLFRPNQPQFFRVILADSLLQNKLAIPKLFARHYGNKLPSCVMLKVPSGQKWKMGIVKAGGEIWLKEGWQRFVEYYSIVVGTFLVFQFDHSDCSFCVSIFDSSTTEIDYPYQVEASQVSEAEQTSTQTPVETNPSRKRKETTQLFSTEPARKMNKVDSSTKSEKGTNPEAKEEKPEEIDRARSSLGSQNASFVIVMWTTYVDFSSNVAIPRPFARKYLRGEKGDAVICDLEGRTWPVQYLTNTIKGTTRFSRSGWKDFVKDCVLRVGDVCMFELIDPAKTMLRVVISRSRVPPVCKSSFPPKVTPATEKSTPLEGNTAVKERTIKLPVEIKEKSPFSSHQVPRKMKVEKIPKETGEEQEREKGNSIVEKGKLNQSKNPTFQVKITKSDSECKSNLNIPISFAMEHIKRKDCSGILSGSDGRKWPIKICSWARTTGITQGWSKFVQDNNLNTGDVCTFELVDRKRTTFSVGISRCRAIGNNDSKELVQKPSFPAAKKFTSHFNVVIRASYLHCKSSVNLPWNFIVKLDQRTQDVKLQVGNRVWCVKLLLYPNHRKGLLSGGWQAFARENCLKWGDVCYFELIDRKSMVIKVIISRAVN